MLIPHLHFCGECAEAIALYEKAFGTKAGADINYTSDDKKIAHADMVIHGQTVFLNDALDVKKQLPELDAVHLIITFKTPSELLACYEILKAGDNSINPFRETPYSKLCGNFLDKFGVMWGFMADA